MSSKPALSLSKYKKKNLVLIYHMGGFVFLAFARDPVAAEIDENEESMVPSLREIKLNSLGKAPWPILPH